MIESLIYSKEFLPDNEYKKLVPDYSDRNNNTFRNQCADLAMEIISRITPTTATTPDDDLQELSLAQLISVVSALQFYRPTARKSAKIILNYIKMVQKQSSTDMSVQDYARVVIDRDALREANESLLTVNNTLTAEVNELTTKLSDAETARDAITRDCSNITRALQTSQNHLEAANNDLKSVIVALQEMTELQQTTETRLYEAYDSCKKLQSKVKKQQKRAGDAQLHHHELLTQQQEIILLKQEILLCQKTDAMLRQANTLLMDENTSLRMQLREEHGKTEELSEELGDAAAANASISKCLSAMTAELQRLRDNSTATITSACASQ